MRSVLLCKFVHLSDIPTCFWYRSVCTVEMRVEGFQIRIRSAYDCLSKVIEAMMNVRIERLPPGVIEFSMELVAVVKVDGLQAVELVVHCQGLRTIWREFRVMNMPLADCDRG